MPHAHIQGFSDKAMNTLLRSKALPGSSNSSKDSTTKDNEQNILMTSAFDLSGAISRLSEEMEKHPEDVIYAFANKQGKLLSHISRDDFSRYLFNVTESLTKADVQVKWQEKLDNVLGCSMMNNVFCLCGCLGFVSYDHLHICFSITFIA